MQFNEEKFELLRCGSDQNIKKSTNLHTERGHIIILKQVKCLGVNLDEEATFHHHIKVMVNNAKGMTGWVLRAFKSRDKEVMLTVESLGVAHIRLLPPTLVPSQKG